MKNKSTPYEIYRKRRESTFKELKDIASKKTKRGNITLTYVDIGSKLKITSQTVYNYIQGNGDGFMAEALIDEFKKL